MSEIEEAPEIPDYCFPINRKGFHGALEFAGYKISKDMRSRKECYSERQPDGSYGDWVSMDDHVGSFIRLRLEEDARTWKVDKRKTEDAGHEAPWVCGDNRWRQLWTALGHEFRHDRFLDWLTTLPPWDGVDRNPFGLAQVEDTELNRWAGWSPIRHAVRRCIDPGAPVHDFIVIIGIQGSGKSSWLKRALPDHLQREMHSDRFKFNADEKVQVEKCVGNVFVEVGELEQARQAHIGAIKETISQDNVTVRLAYKHHPENIDVTWVLYGTANSIDALPSDPSGNRRMIPVELQNGKLKYAERQALDDWWAKNRDQVWAQAIHDVDQGMDPYIPDELWDEQAQKVEKHTTHSELESTAVQWLQDHDPGEITMLNMLIESRIVHTDTVLAQLSYDTKRDAKAALEIAGYKPGRFYEGGKQVRGWVKKNA